MPWTDIVETKPQTSGWTDEIEKSSVKKIGGWTDEVESPSLRVNGTQKGLGYFGPLKRPDNDISTELSVGFNDPEFGGKETEVPLLVPTLTRQEINHLLSGKEATPEILRKAKEHALLRIGGGKSPFAEIGEQGSLPPGYIGQGFRDVAGVYERAAERGAKSPITQRIVGAAKMFSPEYWKQLGSSEMWGPILTSIKEWGKEVGTPRPIEESGLGRMGVKNLPRLFGLMAGRPDIAFKKIEKEKISGAEPQLSDLESMGKEAIDFVAWGPKLLFDFATDPIDTIKKRHRDLILAGTGILAGTAAGKIGAKMKSGKLPTQPEIQAAATEASRLVELPGELAERMAPEVESLNSPYREFATRELQRLRELGTTVKGKTYKELLAEQKTTGRRYAAMEKPSPPVPMTTMAGIEELNIAPGQKQGPIYEVKKPSPFETPGLTTQFVNERGEPISAVRAGATAGPREKPYFAPPLITEEKRIPPVKEAGIAKPLTGFQKFKEGFFYNIVDRFTSPHNLVKRAKELGVELPKGQDPSINIKRWLGENARAESFMIDGTFRTDPKTGISKVTGEGLKQILTDLNKSFPDKSPIELQADLDNFAVAKRTITDLQRPPSGTKDISATIASAEQTAKAQQTINAVHAKYGNNVGVIQQSAMRLTDYYNRLLQYAQDAGLVSSETVENFARTGMNYVHFERILEDLGEATPGMEIGKFTKTPDIGLNPEGVGIPGVPRGKRGLFTKTPTAYKRMTGSEREVYSPTETAIKDTYRILDIADRNKVTAGMAKLAEYFPNEIQILEPGKIKGAPPNNVVSFIENGNRRYMRVSPALARGMRGLTPASMNVVWKIISGPAQLLRTGATITPEFMAANLIRDQFTAYTENKMGYRPFFDIPGAIADIVGRTEIYQEFLRSGAAYAGFVGLDRPSLTRMYEALIKNPSLMKKLNIVADAKTLSEIMEQATRVAAYKRSRTMGMAEPEAATMARTSSVDFGVRGGSTKEINAAVPFLNAGIQGVAKFFREYRANPAGMTLKGVATITVPSIIEYLLYKDDPEFKGFPKYDRYMFWHFKIGDIWIRIPRPFLEGQVFGSIPQAAMEYIHTKDPSAFDGLLHSLYESTSPISGDPASGLVITALKPIVENAANFSFFRRRPIVPESKMGLPAEEQYMPYTSETAKAIGKMVHYSPAKIENLVTGWTGGTGRYLLNLTDIAGKGVVKMAGGKIPEGIRAPFDISDLPLLRRFVERPLASRQSYILDKFYSNAEKVATWSTELNKTIQEKDIPKFQSLIKNHSEIQYAGKFATARKIISEMRDIIDQVYSDKTMSDKEKKQMADRAMQKIIDYADSVNKAMQK